MLIEIETQNLTISLGPFYYNEKKRTMEKPFSGDQDPARKKKTSTQQNWNWLIELKSETSPRKKREIQNRYLPIEDIRKYKKKIWKWISVDLSILTDSKLKQPMKELRKTNEKINVILQNGNYRRRNWSTFNNKRRLNIVCTKNRNRTKWEHGPNWTTPTTNDRTGYKGTR